MSANTDRSELTIRRARPEDRAVLAAHNRAMAWETESKRLEATTVEAGVAAVLAEPTRGFYLVAERAGRVIGQLMVTFEWSDWRNADFWWIQSVYVAPEARRQGIFATLYRHLEAEARRGGRVCGLRLYTEHSNTSAHATYEALGMRPAHYRMYATDWSPERGDSALAPRSSDQPGDELD
jgi:GNAT superfamily N-acetyltransferase